ncbi:MAG: AAA family ATPase, partial [Acidimicrobiia bacterium]
MSAPSTGHAVFGREPELAALHRFLCSLPDGSAALFLIGATGSGKTALWQEGLAAARRRSYRVLSCGLATSEAGYPYAGLGDLLESLGDDTFGSLPDALRRALEIALLREEPAGHRLEARAVAVALRAVLALVAEAGPLVVAIDDVHCLDPPSAHALSFAFRRLHENAIGVLATARPEPPDAGSVDLHEAFDATRLVSLAVGPLDPRSLERLLTSRLGADLSPEILDQIRDASQGNPFFALELGRALTQGSHPPAPGEPLTIPDSLRRLVSGRLAGIPPGARHALLATGALSRPTPAVISAVCQDEEHGADALGDAVEAGLVEIDGDRVRCPHPLLASVAYAEASPERRRHLHAQLASVIEDPEERARHLALAHRRPNETVASTIEEAARRAWSRGAPDMAARLADRAVELTPARLVERRHERMLAAADHHFTAGGMARAQELLESILSAVPTGTTRARALHRLGRIRAHRAEFPAAADLFREALSHSSDDPVVRVELSCGLAFTRLVAGDIPGGAVLAEQALATVDAASGVEAPARLTASICAALFGFLLGQGLRTDLLDRAASIATEWADAGGMPLRPGFLHLPHIPATLLKWSDDFAGARSGYRAALADTVERGDDSCEPWLLYQMSELECWTGNWDEAAMHASRACAVADRTGQRGVLGFALYSRALVAAHRGQVEEAITAADAGLAVSQQTATVTAAALNRSVLGFLALSRGDPDTARAHLGQVRATVSAMGLGDPGVFRCLPDEVEALVLLGYTDEAAALAEQFVEQGRAFQRPWALAVGARGQALCLAASGDRGNALDAVAEAKRRLVHLGMPFEHGRTLLVEGSIRRQTGQKRGAREALEEALSCFESHGAELWAARTRAEISRIAGRPPGPRFLSPTEEQVAALVASGRTNIQVADALFMSVKTVEGKLTRIYRKLGVSSRRELAGLDRLWPDPA